MLSAKRLYEIEVAMYWRRLRELVGENHSRLSQIHQLIADGQVFDDEEVAKFLSIVVDKGEEAYYWRIKGYTAEQIASHMGITRTTVYNALKRVKVRPLNIPSYLIGEVNIPKRKNLGGI